MYPDIEPYYAGILKVSPLHSLYYEEVGRPDGLPIVFLHGGPGGGVHEHSRRFFDPNVFRAILFDQRGAGRSRPFACVEENTTADLIADMEKLRVHLGIQRWMVFGGSWGATLALCYGISHPNRVMALLLRGVFLGRKQEMDWLYGPHGAARLFPESYADFLSLLSFEERKNPIVAYHKRLISGDLDVQRSAVARWNGWESRISQLIPDIPRTLDMAQLDEGLSIARIECHYFVHNNFLPSENHILDNVERLRHIPINIINGRYDLVCPAHTAWELQQALPHAELTIVQDAGHSTTEPGIARALIRGLNVLQHRV